MEVAMETPDEQYKPNGGVNPDMDLEAKAKNLGIAYNKDTGEVETTNSLSQEMEKYQNLLDSVGVPKNITPEDHYTLGEKVQDAISKWWNKSDSENYHASKAKLDKGVEKRVAKGEQKKNLREVNNTISHFERVVRDSNDLIRGYRREVKSINDKRYVAQLKQDEEDRIYKSGTADIKKFAKDYMDKQAKFENGDTSIKYSEIIEAEEKINAMVTDKEEAMSARDHFTLLVDSYNHKIEHNQNMENIAIAVKSKYSDVLMEFKKRKNLLESSKDDLTKVFGDPIKLGESIDIGKKADEIVKENAEVNDAALELVKNLNVGPAGTGTVQGNYGACSAQALRDREKNADSRMRASKDYSKRVSTLKMQMILDEEPSDVFGDKEDKKADSEAA